MADSHEISNAIVLPGPAKLAVRKSVWNFHNPTRPLSIEALAELVEAGQ